MQIRIARLDALNMNDFYVLHSDAEGAGSCYCTAWWVPSWGKWAFHTAEQNRAVREQLAEQKIFDGYLMYDGAAPIGWCQCCPRDWLSKIKQTYNLSADAGVWAVGCLLILPPYREIGLADYFLEEIKKDLKVRGVKYIQGFPRRGKELQADDVWTGPEALFLKAGFKLEQEDDRHPVYGLRLSERSR